MGWLQNRHRGGKEEDTSNACESGRLISNLWSLSVHDSRRLDYPCAPVTTPDTHLRFIPKSEVQAICPDTRAGDALSTDEAEQRPSFHAGSLLWLIIDDVIYDCTDFVHEHPGGTQVIESFKGLDCSWQFWRFHGRQHLEEVGRPLRVGRTKGFENKFREKSRWIGLRKLGVDEEYYW